MFVSVTSMPVSMSFVIVVGIIMLVVVVVIVHMVMIVMIVMVIYIAMKMGVIVVTMVIVHIFVIVDNTVSGNLLLFLLIERLIGKAQHSLLVVDLFLDIERTMSSVEPEYLDRLT